MLAAEPVVLATGNVSVATERRGVPADDLATLVVMSELAPRSELLDVVTGELLPATPENAHAILARIAAQEQTLRTAKSALTEYVIEESTRQGTKTFNTPDGKLVLEGGPETVVEGHELAQLLLAAGMPEENVSAIVTEEITYKVNRAKLKQATSANPDYQAAADLVTTTVEKPWRARAK